LFGESLEKMEQIILRKRTTQRSNKIMRHFYFIKQNSDLYEIRRRFYVLSYSLFIFKKKNGYLLVEMLVWILIHMLILHQFKSFPSE